MNARIEVYERNDPEAAAQREALIVEHLPMVRQVARRIGNFLPPGVEEDDLVQAGVLGLLAAVDRYDSERGVRFSTYAEHRVRGAVLDWLRSADWAPRSLRQAGHRIEEARSALSSELQRPPDDTEIADHLGLTVDQLTRTSRELEGVRLLSLNETISLSWDERLELVDVLEGQEQRSPLDHAELEEFRAQLTEAITDLPERSRLALSLLHVEGLTMREVGDVLGVTESRVSQIYSETMRKLRAALEARGIGDPRCTLSI